MGLLKRIRDGGEPYVDPKGEPLSVSGRGHVDGFLQLEELNTDLQGRQGLEVYDRMFRTDGDVRQVVFLLANPIISGTWEVEAAGGPTADQDAIDDASFVRWALFENMVPNLRGHLMEALPILFRSGFAPFEIVWETTEYEGEKVTVPRALQARLPRTIYRWKMDAYNGLEAVEQYLPVPKAQVISGPNVNLPGNPVLGGPTQNTTGVDNASIQDSTVITDVRMPDYRQTVWMPMSNLVYYRIGAEGDNWEGVSLLRPAYKHWLFKDAIERMDAIAQEKEALGTPVCYPPLGATPDQLDAMEGILQNLRANSQGYIIMPGPKAPTSTGAGQQFGQGWTLEYLSPGQGGSGRDPMPSLQYHSDKLAAAFIAEFIRIGHSLTGGNRNVAETQQDPFLVGVEAIVGLVEEILNAQIVAPLMAWNRKNAKSPPRLRMSLIDATTLTELADFILKLVQVGALIPDQILEDFLRARADLPSADPDAVEARGDLDDDVRREIVIGKAGGGAAPAGTNGPAGSTTGGSASASKGTDNKDKAPSSAPTGPAPPMSAHEALTRKAIKNLSVDDYPPYQPGTERIRWRPQAEYELNVDLDGIEDHLDSAPQRLINHTALTIPSAARAMVATHPTRMTRHDRLRSQIGHILDDAYSFGRQTVSDEVERHVNAGGYALESVQRERAGVGTRADHAATQVLDAMHHAVAHSRNQGDSPGRQQRSAEKAGISTLKAVGRTHVPFAFNQGREDRLLDAAEGDGGIRWGTRYTAILDKNTCEHCRDADDGVIRALDDPVRLERRPPNPDCESNASGQNQCRCFEIPEPMSQEH